MHELAVTRQLLELAEHHAAAADGEHVTDLYLVVGELSSYVSDSIQFYWDIVSKGTVCSGARLHIHRVPARLYCCSCGKKYGLVEGMVIPCPRCGNHHVTILAGQEFRLDSLELDDAPIASE